MTNHAAPHLLAAARREFDQGAVSRQPLGNLVSALDFMLRYLEATPKSDALKDSADLLAAATASAEDAKRQTEALIDPTAPPTCHEQTVTLGGRRFLIEAWTTGEYRISLDDGHRWQQLLYSDDT